MEFPALIAAACLLFALLVAPEPVPAAADTSLSEVALEEREVSSLTAARHKRGVLDLADMVNCTTSCSPFLYLGYGCYCGLLSSGVPVDEIDTCCLNHDLCYDQTSCPKEELYTTPYTWECNGGLPLCGDTVTEQENATVTSTCSRELCRCDQVLVECLQQYPCPEELAQCPSKEEKLAAGGGH